MKYQTLNKDAKAPEKGTKQSAGYDLTAVQKVEIAPLGRAVVSTGLTLEIPDGHYGRIAPRSGLAVSSGIDVLAGVVDSDYRGEVKVVLFNTDIKNYFHVNPGDKIAQIIFEKYFDFSFEKAETTDATARGSNGFGSTTSITQKEAPANKENLKPNGETPSKG